MNGGGEGDEEEEEEEGVWDLLGGVGRARLCGYIPSGMSDHVGSKGYQGLRLDERRCDGLDEDMTAALKHP